MFPKIIREIKTKADIESPELTGTPTVPTPTDDTNTDQAVNIEYVASKLGNTELFPDDSEIEKDSYLATDGSNKFWTKDLELNSISTCNSKLSISSNNLILYGWGKNLNNILNVEEEEKKSTHLTPVKVSNTYWKSVYCAINNVYAISKDENLLYTWGNSYEFLGTGNSMSQYTPHLISATTKWEQLFVNESTLAIFAIDTNGTLYSWGKNSFGQIGNGTTNTQLTPYKISSTTKWKCVIPSKYSIYGITEDDSLYVWGSNNLGQLGAGIDDEIVYTPILVPGNTKWKHIENKIENVTYAIDTDGYLYATGSNSYGHIGDGSTTSKNSFTRIAETTKWKSVLSAINTSMCTLAIDENNLLYAWGNNNAQLIPNGKLSGLQTTPYLISATTKWKIVHATKYNVFAIDEEGYLYGWGKNTVGQLGIGSSTIKYTPVKIGSTKWKAIHTMTTTQYYYSSDKSIFGIDENNYLYSWGSNDNSQLGIGTSNSNQYTPFKISTVTKWKHVESFNGVTHAISIDNDLYSWGYNSQYGLLGNGSPYEQHTPIKITNNAWETILYTSFNNVYGLVKSDITLFINNNELALKKDIHPNNNITEGTYNKVTIDKQGHVINGENESPFPDQTDQKNKPLVTSGYSVSWSENISISHIKPLTDKIIIGTEGGIVYGKSDDMAIGNLNMDRSTLSDKKIAVARGRLAITEDNCLFNNIFYCLEQLNPEIKWKNIHGPQGILLTDTNNLLYYYDEFNTYSENQIFLISSTTKWKYVTSSENTSDTSCFAITEDGYLYAWGYNYGGQLGIGNTEDQLTPVKVGNTKWSKVINSTNYTTFAIDANGYLYAWGYMPYDTETTPYLISSTTKWKNIYSSNDQGIAIDTNGKLYKLTDFYNPQQFSPNSTTKWRYGCTSSENTYGIDENGYLYGIGSNIGLNTDYYSYEVSLISSTTKWKAVYHHGSYSNTYALTEDGYLYFWSNTQKSPYLASFTKWKHCNFVTWNNSLTLISDENNLTLSNGLTYHNKKILTEEDVKIPITVDENGDYVLG